MPVPSRFPMLALTAMTLVFSAPLAKAEGDLKRMEMSARLFEMGLEARDPVLMIAAAKLRRDLPLQKLDRTPQSDAPAPEVEAMPPVSWGDMLDTAAELAGSNPQLSGLIEDIRAESTKGVATGQVYSIASLRAGGTNTYPPLPYEGGRYAEVYVESAGVDMNLYVKDAEGRLVCSDTDKSAIAYCGWRPATTASYTVEVRNKGPQSASYSLITN